MYPNMKDLLKPIVYDDFEISCFEIEKGNARAVIMGIPSGEYIRLTKNGELIMSDTPMEQRTNLTFVHHAHGDVLIGGLGIGMIILAIQNKEEVRSITVIEKYYEVIEMVAGQLPFNEKVKIIESDVFDFKPENGMKYDCIYMDIWSYINTDVYNESMKPLKNKYRKYLKDKNESPSRFLKCWCEYEAKNGVRLL